MTATRDKIKLAEIKIHEKYNLTEEQAASEQSARRYCWMQRQVLPGAIEIVVAPGQAPYAWHVTVYENPDDGSSPDAA